MKNKNIFTIAISAILIVVTAVSFTACSGDKKEEETTTNPSTSETEAETFNIPLIEEYIDEDGEPVTDEDGETVTKVVGTTTVSENENITAVVKEVEVKDTKPTTTAPAHNGGSSGNSSSGSGSSNNGSSNGSSGGNSSTSKAPSTTAKASTTTAKAPSTTSSNSGSSSSGGGSSNEDKELESLLAEMGGFNAADCEHYGENFYF